MGTYVLIDLERSIGTGIIHYWKQNKHGYVTDVNDAGIFTEEFALDHQKSDIDKFTIAVPVKILNHKFNIQL